jgi:hypothetical protein
MFNDVKQILKEGHLGVRTYEEFVDACLARCRSGDERTVALFVLAKLTEPFGEYYFDRPLDEGTAIAFRHRILAAVDALEVAKTGETLLAALSDTIQQELNPPLK